MRLHSTRALRMDRHHRRRKTGGGLNLVALMDIFTILVFFLLVNSSDVQEVPGTRAVQLPESMTPTLVRDTITVMVTSEHILVQGDPVLSVQAAQETKGEVLPLLRTALEARLSARAATAKAHEITVLGDRSLSYSVLKKVMASASAAGFSELSLAVRQRGTQEA
ncbi:MAG: biopolymer transporter ExbD [Pseudomonadota bacterium]|nr:biopolymer transporter ExbD [Pseudomonadota bacterium]